MGRSSEAKDHKNPKKVKCDGRTDGPTDGPTKRGVESRRTRLKTIYRNMYRYDYIAYLDPDEVIAPLQHENWDDMMKALHKPGSYFGVLVLLQV